MSTSRNFWYLRRRQSHNCKLKERCSLPRNQSQALRHSNSHRSHHQSIFTQVQPSQESQHLKVWHKHSCWSHIETHTCHRAHRVRRKLWLRFHPTSLKPSCHLDLRQICKLNPIPARIPYNMCVHHLVSRSNLKALRSYRIMNWVGSTVRYQILWMKVEKSFFCSLKSKVCKAHLHRSLAIRFPYLKAPRIEIHCNNCSKFHPSKAHRRHQWLSIQFYQGRDRREFASHPPMRMWQMNRSKTM